MKHLRSIFEKIVKEDPADALNLPYETDYSALSPDELMVLIDQAAEEGNFKEVERLNTYLKKELSPEEAALLTMESFVQLNESVAEAKVILKRFADEAVRKATPEINRNVNELPT